MPSTNIFTVSQLNREVKQLLGTAFPSVWVKGELSNLAAASSGHLYFTLKDQHAQLRCAMFRSSQRTGLSTRPADGDHVLVRGQLSLYEPRGDYQLIVDRLEAAGDGLLRQRFEALKQRLFAEGLFDEALKRPLPEIPRCIGVVTSPTGAAVHDILTVLQRRFPAIPVIIFPTQVQGASASGEIVQALQRAQRVELCDVILLARGGGSLEDLWAFNEESVARAIRAGQVPVVTGIGHEVDFTIADLAADLRAPTPSAAAAAVTPDRLSWSHRLIGYQQQLTLQMRNRLMLLSQHQDWLAHRLQISHPLRRLQTTAQHLDDLELRLRHILANRAERRQQQLTTLTDRLHRNVPSIRLTSAEHAVTRTTYNLGVAWARCLQYRHAQLDAVLRALDTLSPLATLGRGYALLTDAASGNLITSVRMAQPGETLSARLADGTLQCKIESRRAAETPE